METILFALSVASTVAGATWYLAGRFASLDAKVEEVRGELTDIRAAMFRAEASKQEAPKSKRRGSR